jgi:uncharacterized protein YggE
LASESEPLPKIVVSGTGEVRSAATKASFTVGVTTSASNPAAAGADTARIAKAVTDALERARLSKGAIKSSELRVHPSWQYDQTSRQNRQVGYEATSTMRIEVSDLDHVGSYLDAALTGGTTDVSEASFSVEDEETPRRQALALAVAHARADAETLARAAGGTLGELIELRTDVGDLRVGVMTQAFAKVARARGGIDTNIVPDEIQTTARVIASWRYVAEAMPTGR